LYLEIWIFIFLVFVETPIVAKTNNIVTFTYEEEHWLTVEFKIIFKYWSTIDYMWDTLTLQSTRCQNDKLINDKVCIVFATLPIIVTYWDDWMLREILSIESRALPWTLIPCSKEIMKTISQTTVNNFMICNGYIYVMWSLLSVSCYIWFSTSKFLSNKPVYVFAM
jgi:hypothetical protein